MKPRRIAIMLGLDWPYKRHTAVFEGTQRYALEHGWRCELDEFADHTLKRHTRRTVPYDGVLSRATKRLAAEAARLRIPIVNTWAGSPVAARVPTVNVDDEVTGVLRAEHLLDRGFRRFACLMRTSDPSRRVEAIAFANRLAEAGYPCHMGVTPVSSSSFARSQRSHEITAKWIDKLEPPVGVYIYDEHAARQVVQICRNRGWNVPQDVAIIAGYNEESLCSHPPPGLTSIEVGFERIGYEAARLLDRLLDGEPAPTKPILLPPVGLVVRESTDFFAVEDTLVAQALQYISAHLSDPLSVAEVAEAVDTSRRNLEYRFQEALKRTIAGEIRRLRLARAKRMLAESDIPIARIARATGFSDATRLSETFRRETGMTPRDYRKQLL